MFTNQSRVTCQHSDATQTHQEIQTKNDFFKNKYTKRQGQ